MSLASFWTPDYLPVSAWVKHGPFAFWLVDRLKPRRFVELGTHHGFSFFAFCQAIDRFHLGTSAFAVDTWTGDEHAGRYDDEVFSAVAAHNVRYSSFSTLVRNTFDEALGYFEDGSIDLLHIDGQHHYEDVKRDYESWLPKLTDDATVLFHDTNVRERQFGVWKFFKDLSVIHPSFEFFHGHGLGVLCPGVRVPDGLRELVACDAQAADATRLTYASLGASVEHRQKAALLRDGLSALLRPNADLSQKGLSALAIASGDDIAVVDLGMAVDASRRAAVQAIAECDARVALLEAEHASILADLRAGDLARAAAVAAEHAARIASVEAEARALVERTVAAERGAWVAEREAEHAARIESVEAEARALAERAVSAERGATAEALLLEASASQVLSETEARLAAASVEASAARAEVVVDMVTIDLLRACLRGRDGALHRLRSRPSWPKSDDASEGRVLRSLLAAKEREVDAMRDALTESRRVWVRDAHVLRRWGSAGHAYTLSLADASARAEADRAQVEARLDAIENNRFWRAYSRIRPGLRLPPRPSGGLLHDDGIDSDAGMVDKTGLFDREYYLAENPDVAALGVDPVEHFAQSGWKEGRKPNPHFDPDFYLAQRPDVAEHGINPLLHYALYGIVENQDIKAEAGFEFIDEAGDGTLDSEVAQVQATGLFDETYYLSASPDLAGKEIDLVRHFVEAGWREGRNPSAQFDTSFYLGCYPDVASSGVNPLLHFARVGAAEGRMPRPPVSPALARERDALSEDDLRLIEEIEDTGLFDRDYYASIYPDIAASGLDPALHYARDGWREGRRPSALFDPASYLRLNPDVAEAGQNPLLHFSRYGAAEGRPVLDPASLWESETMTPAARELADLHRRKVFTSEATSELASFMRSNKRISFPKITEPDISVLVILWNQAHLTLRCLMALAAQEGPTTEIILVDNASTDGTMDLLSRFDGIKVIRNDDNEGFLLACNRGAAVARGRTLLLLNSDAFVRDGALSAALNTLDSSRDIGAVGGRLILPSGRLQEAGSIIWADSSTFGYGRNMSPEAGEAMFRRDVDYCSGAFLLTPLDVWKRLDGFDPAYVPAYYEEADYCMRLREHGLRVVYEPHATIDHFEFGSEKKRLNTLKLSRANRKVFRQRHALALSRFHVPPSEGNIVSARTCSPLGQRRLLIIDNEVPYRSLGSGYPRAREMVQEAASLGWFVTFYPLHQTKVDWVTARGELSADIEIASGWGAPKLAEFLEERRGLYQTVVVSRPDNMTLMKTIIAEKPYLVSDMRVIYDAEALFSVRDILLAEWNSSPIDRRLAETMTTTEIGLARGADAVICVSPPEAEIFRNRTSTPVYVLNHPTVCITDTPGFAQRAGFLFVGRLLERGTPNWVGLAWFVQRCWPRIRAHLPHASLTVVGALNPNHAELEGPGINLLGRVDDIDSVYAASRVFLAPVHFAAGIPIKVLEASAAGLPTVATTLMAKQLSWEPGVDLYAVDDALDFADRAIDLHEDQSVWNLFVAASRQRMEADFGSAQFRDTLALILDGKPPLRR